LSVTFIVLDTLQLKYFKSLIIFIAISTSFSTVVAQEDTLDAIIFATKTKDLKKIRMLERSVDNTPTAATKVSGVTPIKMLMNHFKNPMIESHSKKNFATAKLK